MLPRLSCVDWVCFAGGLLSIHSWERQGEGAEGEGGGELERRQAEHPRVWARAPQGHGFPIHPQLLLTLAFQPRSALLGFCILEAVPASSCLRQHIEFAGGDSSLSDREGGPVRVDILCTCQAWGSSETPVAASSTLAQAACSHRAVKPSSQDPSEDVRICWAQTTLFSSLSTPVAVCG